MGYYRVIMAAGAEVVGFRRNSPTREVAVSGSAPVQVETPRRKLPRGGRATIIFAAAAVVETGLEIAKHYLHTPALSDVGIRAIEFMGGHGGNPSPEQQNNIVDSYCQVHNLGPDCTSK